MKNKIKELKAKQAKELAEALEIETLRDALKDVPGFTEDSSICLHSGEHASVKLWSDYHTGKKLIDAVRVVEHFKDKIIDGEHWKSGCVSTWPAEINSCIKYESAVMDGSHAVEIDVSGGRGYGPNTSVQFWTRIAGVLCEIECPVCDLWKLIPAVKGRYTQEGDFIGKIEWNPAETQTVDSFRKFWSEPPSFKGSYYLADIHNFRSWVSRFLTPEEMAVLS